MTNWGEPTRAAGTRALRRTLAGVAAAGALSLGACATVTDGHPSFGSPTGTPSTSSKSPDFTGQPSSAAPTSSESPAALHALLMTAPSGSQPGSGAWATTAYPTPIQFAQQFYPPDNVADIVAQLKQQGLASITHRTWIADNGTEADVVLFAFDSAGGAQLRYASATSSQKSNAGVVSVSISGTAHPALGYRHGKSDSDGYTTGIVYSASGSVVAEVFTYTPHNRFDSGNTIGWAKTQIARLPAG